MQARIGLFDPAVGRELTAGDVAAITVIQSHFYIEDSETANKDCLNLWDKIFEWDTDGVEFNGLKDFLCAVKQQEGFVESSLCNAVVFSPNLYTPDFIEYLNDLYCNLCAAFV